MKVRDIITESAGTLRKTEKNASPGTSTFPDLDNNNCPYLAYRYGMALAGSPDFDADVDESSAMGSQFITVSYSDKDEEIVTRAAKHMNVKKNTIAARGSKESEGTHTVSPVAKPKPNKYGV